MRSKVVNTFMITIIQIMKSLLDKNKSLLLDVSWRVLTEKRPDMVQVCGITLLQEQRMQRALKRKQRKLNFGFTRHRHGAAPNMALRLHHSLAMSL